MSTSTISFRKTYCIFSLLINKKMASTRSETDRKRVFRESIEPLDASDLAPSLKFIADDLIGFLPFNVPDANLFVVGYTQYMNDNPIGTIFIFTYHRLLEVFRLEKKKGS